MRTHNVTSTVGMRSVAALLRRLEPAHRDWHPLPGRWVFRGQGNADWPLLPKAFRRPLNGTIKLRHDGTVSLPGRTYRDQIRAEIRLLFRFLSHANDQGLPVPDGCSKYLSTAHYRYLDRWTYDEFPMFEGQAFPPDWMLQSLALAQHHGIPTRLLDWTLNPLAAAYFAAIQCLTEQNRPMRLAVWALDSSYVQAYDGDGGRIKLFQPPKHGNLNLVAQDGLFTFHRTLTKGNERPDTTSSEESLYKLLAANWLKGPDDTIPAKPPRLFKITLDARHASELLEELSLRRVDATRLFPGYAGAARALWDETHYPDTLRPTNFVESSILPSVRLRSDAIVMVAPSNKG